MLHGGSFDSGLTHGDTWDYDPVGKRVVVFGGFQPNVRDLGDTWAWDGSAWSVLSGWRPVVTPGPAPRYLPGISYDVARRALVLFGGGDPGSHHAVQRHLGVRRPFVASGEIVRAGVNPAHTLVPTLYATLETD